MKTFSPLLSGISILYGVTIPMDVNACTLNLSLQSELSDVSPNEQFTTSLGVDQSVRITSRPVGVVHGSHSGVLKKNKLVTYTHSFVVKNTKTDTVNIQVSEQVPLSTDDRIKVSLHVT